MSEIENQPDAGKNVTEEASPEPVETSTEEAAKTEATVPEPVATSTEEAAKTEATVSEPVVTSSEEAAKSEETVPEPVPQEPEEISYHAVEKEGAITAIWEMQGQKHIRTISARSEEGKKILSLFTSEIHETDSPGISESQTASEEASA